jgi:hypothetical protein
MKYKKLITYGIALLVAYQLGSCYGKQKTLEDFQNNLEVKINEYEKSK